MLEESCPFLGRLMTRTTQIINKQKKCNTSIRVSMKQGVLRRLSKTLLKQHYVVPLVSLSLRVTSKAIVVCKFSQKTQWRLYISFLATLIWHLFVHC